MVQDNRHRRKNLDHFYGDVLLVQLLLDVVVKVLVIVIMVLSSRVITWHSEIASTAVGHALEDNNLSLIHI